MYEDRIEVPHPGIVPSIQSCEEHRDIIIAPPVPCTWWAMWRTWRRVTPGLRSSVCGVVRRRPFRSASLPP